MTPRPLAVAILAALTSVQALADEPIAPIRPAQKINLAQAELGKKLYFDPRLSKSGGSAGWVTMILSGLCQDTWSETRDWLRSPRRAAC